MASTTDLTTELAARVFTDPSAYADEARFHAACARLRRDDPVPYVDVDGYEPFWAVTRHGDLMDVERDLRGWLAGPRPVLGPKGYGDPAEVPVRTLVQMDPPDHTKYRRISADWFKPSNIARLGDRAARLAKRSVDRMADLGSECDFVTDVAVHYPLYIIMAMLGIPESDYPWMLTLTQELFGSNDPEMARGGTKSERGPSGFGVSEPPRAGSVGDTARATLLDFFEYFQRLIDDRRANPTDDLASVIANSEIDGEPIGVLEAVGYYVIIATAGHDTTSSAISGGVAALLAHPDQLQLLTDDVSLVPTAVEEMLRWVSPVKQFVRTAVHEHVIGGVTIPDGGQVLLSFPSANRDEAVFEHPDTFDVTRDPNPHVAFGFGAHYCLGTHLARLETRAFFDELVPRIVELEPACEPEFMRTLFVGGPKHVPVRYRLR
ncbi:MAG TPA: cytochrome P450 [Acidimicrobiia bacterium]|nr:cytochrome P450 [Acidimicrobiia bacterium]